MCDSFEDDTGGLDMTAASPKPIASFNMLLLPTQKLTFKPSQSLSPLNISASPQAASFNAGKLFFFRPESQADWETQKDAIRNLYLEENLPLKELIGTMLEKHSFSATMYKRQFQKWNWKKYNTKAHQQSLEKGVPVETSNGKPRCRRPSRKHPRHDLVWNSTTVGYTNGSLHYVSRHTSAFPHTMLYGNHQEKWTESIYSNLRNLIHGNARQDLNWNTSYQFDRFPNNGHSVFTQIILAIKLFDAEDLLVGGPILRQAFREVEDVIESDAIAIHKTLLLDIPHFLLTVLRKPILLNYMHHLSLMLWVKKRAEPITLAAVAMQKLFSTDYNSSEHTVKRMHTVLADCYIDIRGKLDFHGREAKADAMPACNTTGNAGALCTQDFFNSYKHQLDSAVKLFHENSGNFHDVALGMLYVAKELDFRGSDILKLCKMGRRLIEAENSASRGEWRCKTLGNYGLYSYHAFWCLEKRGNMGLALFYLHESMTVTDLAASSTGNERLKDHYASNALFGRLRLIEELTMIGRVEEAAEIRAGVIASPFLRKAMENEVGEQF